MKAPSLLFHPRLIHICRLFLALVFISASIGKILDIPEFIKAVTAYQLLPGFLLTPLGHFLPWLEFMVGLALLTDRWPAGATLLANLMLLLFIIIILISLARGLEIDCGCFAIIKNDSLLKTLVRDILFLIPGLILYSWYRVKPNKVENP